MKRTSLSKSIRFEVFKRDGFKCQYCGASAPEAILEVDHIIPVSKGGTNDIMNLVTACRECNCGKSNKELTDKSAVQIQRKQLEEIQARREQLEMMLQWRQSLIDQSEDELNFIDNLLKSETELIMFPDQRREMKRVIRKFGFWAVCDAIPVALDTYYKDTESSFRTALEKVGGICFNRRKVSEANAK